MEKLFKISELSKDVQEKIYNEYIEESGVTKEETSIEDFIDYSLTYMGNVYTIDGKFIEYYKEYEHTPKEMAEKLMNFISDFSDNEEDIKTETEYVAELFDKLQKSDDFEILANYLDVMFMNKVFNII